MRLLALSLLIAISTSACGSSAENTESELNSISSEINIIPRPLKAEKRSGVFPVNTSTTIVSESEQGLAPAELLKQVLRTRSGMDVPVERSGGGKSIRMVFEEPRGVTPVRGAYSISTTPDGIEMRGDAEGLFWAVRSLEQTGTFESGGTALFQASEISDAPRFQYRGMHLDVSRHFMPVEAVKRYIDTISRYKFNYFHWHLTDDQGWRIEISRYPKLTEIGSKRSETVIGKSYNPYRGDGIPVEGFYSRSEVADIVNYAKSRGVTIVPEIDMPGHAAAAVAAYPEYGCIPGAQYRVKTTWGGHPDTLCPTDDTIAFLKDLLTEVAQMFPDSPYIHIGGDEVDYSQWDSSPKLRELKQREGLNNNKEVFARFKRQITEFINQTGKTPVVWDEAFENSPELDAVTMGWRGSEYALQAAASGRKVIMSPNTHAYFDRPQADEGEPLSLGKTLTTEMVYHYDPAPKSLDPVVAGNILGAQANVWTEFIKTPERVEYMVFPRALAMAEAVWSSPSVKNYRNFQLRLALELARLESEGINFRIPEPIGLFSRNLSLTETFNVALTAPVKGSTILIRNVATGEETQYDKPFSVNPMPGETVLMEVTVVTPAGRRSSPHPLRVSRGVDSPSKDSRPMPEREQTQPVPTSTATPRTAETSPSPTPVSTPKQEKQGTEPAKPAGTPTPEVKKDPIYKQNEMSRGKPPGSDTKAKPGGSPKPSTP